MAQSACCCLNLSPPTSSFSQSSHPTKAPQFPWAMKERSWKSQCVLGVACVIIGLEAENIVGSETMAAAAIVQPAVESSEKGNRWSDKRACPPWRLNALETIVPENLPRPSARRRWEGVGHARTAPAVKVTVRSSGAGGCFSM
ncbi:hypothetical protein U1Q18_018713 [Sarracenia purpurea var. burkii]